MSGSHVQRDTELGCMRCQGYSGAVVPAPTKGILCGDALAGALMSRLPLNPWGLFLWPLLLCPDQFPNC
jgi:hypothetical protein